HPALGAREMVEGRLPAALREGREPQMSLFAGSLGARCRREVLVGLVVRILRSPSVRDAALGRARRGSAGLCGAQGRRDSEADEQGPNGLSHSGAAHRVSPRGSPNTGSARSADEGALGAGEREEASRGGELDFRADAVETGDVVEDEPFVAGPAAGPFAEDPVEEAPVEEDPCEGDVIDVVADFEE